MTSVAAPTVKDLKLIPKDWGAHTWKALHYIAIGYPQKPSAIDKINYSDFFMSLHKVLPCMSCADHYKAMIEKFPPTKFMSNPDDLFQWTVDIHNKVNERLGYPKLSLEQAVNLFKTSIDKKPSSSSSSSSTSSTNTNYLWGIFALLILVIILLTIYKVIYGKKNSHV